MMNYSAAAGVNDFPAFAEGWHDRERDGRCGIEYRAGRERALLRLARRPGATKLHLLLSGPRGLSPRQLEGTVSVNGKRIALQLDADLWVVRSITLEGTAEELEVGFELPGAPCPDHVLKNGDGRRLGWFLSAAWQME